MAVYHIYGLRLASELDLPEIFSSNAGAMDLQLVLGPVAFDPPDTSRVICRVLSAGNVVVHFRGVGKALVKTNGDIILQPENQADPLTLRLFVLQQVLGVAVLIRGFFVLHAAAAVLDGKAVAFSGSSGQGKSTMTAAMSRLGCPVLTDDVLAIDLSEPAKPMALPGLAQLKLTEESRAVIGPEIVGVQSIRDRSAKKLCAIRGAAPREPVPLHSIYVLNPGPGFEVRSISPGRAAIELVRQTYGVELLPHIGRSADHFGQCTALARQVSISVLSRPRDLSRLDEIARGVMERVRRSPLS